MEKIKIEISNNITLSDIQLVIDIQNRIITGKEEVFIIYFTDAEYLDAAVSVLIGTLPIYASKLGKKVLFRFKDTNSPILNFLKKLGYTSILQIMKNLNILHKKLFLLVKLLMKI